MEFVLIGVLLVDLVPEQLHGLLAQRVHYLLECVDEHLQVGVIYTQQQHYVLDDLVTLGL